MNKVLLTVLSLVTAIAFNVSAQDFQPGQAKVTATSLKARNIPSTGGVEVFSFNRGDVLDVIERSNAKSEVDGISDFWYKVKFTEKKTSKTGWVFGGYVSFELNMESGLRWKSVTPTSGMTIRNIAISEAGDVFIGTDGNIFTSTDNGRTWRKIVPQALGINIGKIKKVTIIKKDIYIAAGKTTEGGVWKSSNNGVAWSQSTTAQGLSSNDVNDVTIGPDNTIYAATANGVCTSNDNGATWKPLTEPALNMNVLTLMISSSGQIFAGTDNGLYTITDVKKTFGGMKKEWTLIGDKSPNMGKEIKSLAITADGDLYVGTTKGLNKCNISALDKWFGIGGTVVVNDILIESNSRISVATDNGLNISLDKGASWVTYKKENGLASNSVRKITLNKKRKVLWVISGNDAICYHE